MRRADTEKLDCDVIKNNFQQFPFLVKHMGYNWLEKKCEAGPPDHQLLVWSSKIVIPEQSRALTWVNHFNECLNFFAQENEQGKREVISGLKDNANFIGHLSQLEIGLKLRKNNYNVLLEDRSVIENKPIDILARKDRRSLAFEVAALDMYLPLKLSAAATVPDRVKTKLFEKLEQLKQIIRSVSFPIIIVLNLTQSPESDLNGVLRALQGTDTFVIEQDESGIFNTYTTHEKDPTFVSLEEAKGLSAVIYYNAKYTHLDIKLEGMIIPNDSAAVKLEEDVICELKDILFGSNTMLNA